MARTTRPRIFKGPAYHYGGKWDATFEYSNGLYTDTTHIGGLIHLVRTDDGRLIIDIDGDFGTEVRVNVRDEHGYPVPSS